ncbi:MAG TPA: hypothetical protein VF110_08125 [Burkholderiales bacterium]
MNDTTTSATSAALTRFDFVDGEHRGSHMTLYAGCLVHRGDAHLETLPLATITSVRVSFERGSRYLAWGVALLVVAAVLLLIAAPIAEIGGRYAGELAAAGVKDGVGRALFGMFRVFESIGNALPFAAGIAVLGGGALAALGWLGSTILTLTFAGAQRVYAVRGRNTSMLDFTEAVSERVMQARR